MTDGTAPGTHEVALKDKPFIRGLFGEISFRGAVVGNEVAFSGTDILGQTGLWESDGLSAREVVPVLSVAGLTSLPSAPASPAPPAPSGLALAKSSDSGVLGDRITKVTRPTITGKGVAGDTVRLFDGAKAVGSVKVAAGGVWFVTAASALAAGVHSLTATESGAGGTSKASAPLSLTIKTSAPAPAGLSFAVAADKGPAGDTFTVAGKGEAGDTVTLFDGLKAVGSAKVAAGGGWSITTAAPLAAGTHNLRANATDVAANKSGFSPTQVLTVGAARPNPVVFAGTARTDLFTGGAGDDVFQFSTANLAATDRVNGRGGSDELLLSGAGTVHAAGVAGVELYLLGGGAPNLLALTNANFAGVTGSAITVDGGNAGNTIDASAVTGANHIVAVGGAGADLFTGGAGGDTFQFSAANLSVGDIVKGGGGTDELLLTSAGTIHAGGVGAVETYVLASGGRNTLGLTTGNFAGVAGNAITVTGGANGNTISESTVAAADRAVMLGGADADTLIAGPNAAMTGGGGKDVFELTTPGSATTLDNNTIADFTHGTDQIAFSKTGFALGAKPVAATLFTANGTGHFTKAAQRFAYDTASGALFYDARGNAAGSTRLEIANLTHHPTLTA
ncbi:MAG TPA: Ig-like domain-containing protein, partial [Thermomicrobiales bacterium]|nr:Ig-like domain-containing protein [Thermomicrobiales bacterium]